MNPSQLIGAYLEAKDHNQPALMGQAFAPDAELEMVVNTGAISFPPQAQGLAAITDILVHRFAESYENVRTFCVAAPPPDEALAYHCRWLVGMSEVDGGAVRVGCGGYDWRFEPGVAGWRVRRLRITIEQMQHLPAEQCTPVMNWLIALPRPWCPAPTLVAAAPAIEALRPVIAYLA